VVVSMTTGLLDRTARLPREAFAGRHVLSMNQYSRTDLEALFEQTDRMAAALATGTVGAPLAGRVLVSAFFDRSTRTRLAHEVAMLRLGGTVTGFADAEVTRAGGDTKESLPDLFTMLGMYGDVIVTRLTATGAASTAAAALRHGPHHATVINGGDGTGEHPTQALTDLYTMRQLFGGIDGLRVLVVNDLRMRCVRSLLRGLRRYDCEIHTVAAPGQELEPELRAECPVVEHASLAQALPRVDVAYSSPTVSIARDVANQRACAIDRATVERAANRRLKVLHPLPRGAELATDLDETRHAGWWAQARNGIPVRMALLALMFDRPV
jgi:aspartate carbamoyltransferase catalytic subunit